MQHFPIFLDLAQARVVLAGGGAAALAKLRLLMKTPARIEVFAPRPAPEIEAWAAEGRLALHRRAFAAGDASGAALAYAAGENEAEDARVTLLARADGALVNAVDNLEASDFITPALVDRSPVTVAIGTEGAAPVLARALKAEFEARLAPGTGPLATAGKAFRDRAEALPHGRARREFWAEWYDAAGPAALDRGADLGGALETLLARHLARDAAPGHVDFVGAGPGDPELLTLKARKALDRADVVIHDRLVSPEILELARREALIVDAGKEGFGPSVPQSEINRMIVAHAGRGAHVVRLKSGDPGIFGRLDEEIEAVEAAGIGYAIVPGITAASAAAAGIGQGLTRRGRNASLRILTGHDVKGFADHDWRALARPGEVAAIYMGKRAARFLAGRLMMHGAGAATPVTVVENASRRDARSLSTTLSRLPEALDEAAFDGPAVILYGLAPRAAAAVQDDLPAKEIAL